MRKTLSVAALMLALCCPALAGEMPTPPAPQPQSVTVQEPTGGEMQNDAPDSLTQTALDLLALLSSVF